MQVELKAISQEIDFDTGEVTNILTFVTPEGQRFQAITTDAAIEALRGSIGAAPSLPKPPAPTPRTEASGYVAVSASPDAVFFGGDLGSNEPSPPPPPPEPSSRVVPPGKPAPQRTVPKDEYGYPVVQGGGVDHRDVVGPGASSVDEDNIPSI